MDANVKMDISHAENPGKYYEQTKSSEIDLGEALARFVEKVRRLQKERTDLIREIEKLGDEAEKEAHELEKEVSTLKEQALALKEVLSTMRMHKKRV